MLVSHRKKFIFTKTQKTAGTSVESYFEPYSFPEGQWRPSEDRDVYESGTGIVGRRGPNPVPADCKWYNHMPAQEIRNQLPRDVWSRYFKFTVIRNPYDKLVSGFYWFDRARSTYGWGRRAKAAARRLVGRGSPIDLAQGDNDVERFRSWLMLGGGVIDQNAFLIDGECCVDFFIRFEYLQQDIQKVCDRIGVEPVCGKLSKLKSGIRSAAYETSDFYDQECVRIVEDRYAFEIDRFGYQLLR